MTVLRVTARPMLASMFVYGGLQALKDPARRAVKAQPVADLIRKAAPEAPVNGANLVRANAAIHVLAGAALATGRAPRLSALVLAATMPPTTVAGHQFWKETDPVQRTNQTYHFLKNVGLTGGLLLSTLDPEPKKKILARRAKDRVVETTETVKHKLSS